jgi:hypothetical protein
MDLGVGGGGGGDRDRKGFVDRVIIPLARHSNIRIVINLANPLTFHGATIQYNISLAGISCYFGVGFGAGLGGSIAVGLSDGSGPEAETARLSISGGTGFAGGYYTGGVSQAGEFHAGGFGVGIGAGATLTAGMSTC